MNVFAVANQWADTWARYMVFGVQETTFLLGFVVCLYYLFRKKMSSRFVYWLFLFVILKPVIPIEIRVPQWMVAVSPKCAVTSVIESGISPFFPPDKIKEENPFSSFVSSSMENENLPATDSPIYTASPTEEKKYSNTILMGMWSIIVFLLLIGFSLSQWYANRWVRRTVLSNKKIQNSLYMNLLQNAGLKRNVELYESRDVTSAMTVGLFKPRLFVPAGFFDNFNENEASWILLHELEHIKRFDLWVIWMQRFIQIIFFINPAMWVANWVVNLFREFACDDAALSISKVSGIECGESLLKALKHANQTIIPVEASLGLLYPYSSIRNRLSRILDSRRLVKPYLSYRSAMILGIIAILFLPSIRAMEIKGILTSFTIIDVDKSENQTGVYALHGIVIDKDTKSAVSEAEICLYLKSGFTSENKKFIKKAISNKEGKFSIKDIPSDVYYPVVFAKNYQPFHRDNTFEIEDPNSEILIHSSNPDPEIFINLKKGLSARITVLSPDGEPLQDAKVTLFSDNLRYHNFSSNSDKNGRVLCNNLPGSKAKVLVQKSGFGETVSALFTPGSQTNPAEITLKMTKPSNIQGSIVDKEGRGIEGITFRLRYSELSNNIAGSFDSFSKQVVTNKNGEYQFNDLGTGLYSLLPISNDPSSIYWVKEQLSPTINLKPGENLNLTYHVERKDTAQSLHLKIVSSDNQPLPGSTVNIYPENLTYINKKKTNNLLPLPCISLGYRSNESGDVFIQGLYPFEKYNPQILLDGYIQTGKEGTDDNPYPYEYTNNTQKIVLARLGSLQGSVMNKNTHTPVPETVVSVKRMGDIKSTVSFAVTSKEGNFTIKNLLPGKYALEIAAPGIKKQKFEGILINNDKITKDVSIMLEKEFFITTRIPFTDDSSL